MLTEVGIVTVSDRCSSGEKVDESGANLKRLFDSCELIEARTRDVVIVPDDVSSIQMAVVRLCATGCRLVVTTGGTGVAPRDVTPEAVLPLLQRRLPGVEAMMTAGSLATTRLAALSRPVVGCRDAAVIICVPGSRAGAEQCVRLAAPVLPHALDLLAARSDRVAHTHEQLHYAAHVAQPAGENLDRHTDDVPKAFKSGVCDRARASQFEAVSVECATNAIMRHVGAAIVTEQRPLLECEGLTVADDARAAVSLPPFIASVKDGYAVRSSDETRVRQVAGVSCAGHPPPTMELRNGQCVRISTGAEIPGGADAVVMVEHTSLVQRTTDVGCDEEQMVAFHQLPVTAGQDVRPVGSDFGQGDAIVKRGATIGPFELAALTAAGVQQLLVFKRASVGVLSSGDELIDIGDAGVGVQDGRRVYDANRHTLAALVRRAGAQVVDLGIVCDSTVDAIAKRMRQSLRTVDVLVTSGGVSMGERDLLKHALVAPSAGLAADIHFGRVLVKPGLPTTFATLRLNGCVKFVFCLPGNPVSAAVCCTLFVLPAVRRLMGATLDRCQRITRVKLSHAVSLDARPEYKRAIYVNDGDGCGDSASGFPRVALTTEDQRSSNVLSLVGCQLLLQLPPRSELNHQLEADAELDAIVL